MRKETETGLSGKTDGYDKINAISKLQQVQESS